MPHPVVWGSNVAHLSFAGLCISCGRDELADRALSGEGRGDGEPRWGLSFQE